MKLTVGSSYLDEKWPYAERTQVQEIGATHVDSSIAEAVVDAENKVVTSPAYMYEGQPHEIFDSVGKMVDAVVDM